MRGSYRQNLVSILALLVGAVSGSVFTFLGQVLLGRAFTPAVLGELYSALYVGTTLSALVGMGLDGYILKHVAKYGVESLGGLLQQSIRYIVLTFIVVALVFVFFHSGQGLQQLLVSTIMGQVAITMLVAVSLAQQEFRQASLWPLLQSGGRLAVVIGAVGWLGLVGNQGLMFVYQGFSIIGLTISLVFAARLFRLIREMDVKLNMPVDNLTSIARKASPFGVGVFFHAIYYQSDIVILKLLAGADKAGIYFISGAFLGVCYILPGVIYQKFFSPKVHLYAETANQKKLKALFFRGGGGMFILGCSMALIMALLGPYVVPRLFGEGFEESGQWVQFLAPAIVFRYLASNYGIFLITGELIKKKNKYMGVVAGVNIVLTTALVPFWGIGGAVASTVVSEFMLLSFFFVGAKNVVYQGAGSHR